MIRKMVGVLMVLSFVVLAGCGGGDAPPSPPRFTVQIPRDQANDADIARTATSDVVTPAAINRNVLFGISPGVEYRALLDFPLDGSTGGAIIRGTPRPRIVSADLEVFIKSINVATQIPAILDILQYTNPAGPVVTSDFNKSEISFRRLTFNPTDQGNYVRIDVTGLVADAFAQGTPRIQFRFLYDFVANPNGLVEIDDGLATTAPLLTITYE